MIKQTAALLGLLGLAVAIGLFVWQGITPVLQVFATAGWGVVWVALFHAVPMLLNARAWQVLLPVRLRPSLPQFFWAVWLREAVNGLLPVARIGGEVVTAKLLMQMGLRPAHAVASLVADITLCLLSQASFTLIALGLLFTRYGNSNLLLQMLVAALVALPVIGGLVFAQRLGIFSLLQRGFRALFGDKFAGMLSNAAALDSTLRRLYRRRAAIIVCFLWQLLAWGVGSGEIYLALQFLGHGVSFADAMIMEALVQALGSGAFVVPGALGVQEGGFVLAAGLLGIPPDTALALALTRRARDMLIFVPALLVWQWRLGGKIYALPASKA